MRKIIGVCVALCFFINNVSFALTPALKMGTLGGETYHDKFLYYAEAGLERSLLELNELSAIRGAKDIKTVKRAFTKKSQLKGERSYFSEKTIFNPLRVKSFFNLVEHVGGNIFAVPIVVEKKSINVCENYRLLFSTVYDEENKGFPVFYCTREEFEEKRIAIAKKNALPVRSKKENERFRQSKLRYATHNAEVDDFIERHTEKRHFTEIKNRAEKLGWNKKHNKRFTPKAYLPENYFHYMQKEIDAFLKYIGAGINVDAAFKEKNVVLIRVSEWEKFPNIEEDEKKFKVTSHTSENAVYKFLTKKEFNTLIDENGLTDETKKVLDETIIDFIHEIGVIYNLKWEIGQRDPGSDRRSTIHALDRLYTDYRHNKYGIQPGSQKVKYIKEMFAKGPRNLDHLSVGNIPRDYANAEEADTNVEDYERASKLLGKKLAVAMYKETKGQVTISELIESYEEYLTLRKDHLGVDSKISSSTEKSLERIQTWLKLYIRVALAYIITAEGQRFPEIEDLSFKDPDIEESPKSEKDVKISLNIASEKLSPPIDIAVRQESVDVLRNMFMKPSTDLAEKLMKKIEELKSLVNISSDGGVKTNIDVTYMLENFVNDEVLEQYYGTKDHPVTTEETVKSIRDHLLMIKNEKDNLYRQAVERDIQTFCQKDNKVTIKISKAPENVKELLNKWKEFKEGEGIYFSDALLFYALSNDSFNMRVDMKKYFKEALPFELKNWILKRYSAITGTAEGMVRNDNDLMFDENINVTMELILYVTDCLERAAEMELIQIEGEFYVSPTTREISHVGRGIKKEKPGVWLGGKFYEKFSQGKYAKDFALFLFNEAQHMNNFEVGHGRIKSLEDIRTANDHVAIPAIKEIEYDYIEHDLKPWGELLPGGIVGQSERIKMMFERVLEPFAQLKSQDALLISGAPGAGGTQGADAVREIMGIEKGSNCVKRMSCAELSSLPEVLTYLANNAEKRGKDARSLVIIDDLSYAVENSEKAKTIKKFLRFILDESKQVVLPDGKILDISNIKIVGVIDEKTLKEFPLDLRRKFDFEVQVPNLGERGDDIMRIAEKVNFEESKKNGIPYSGFDEGVSSFIKNWAKNSEGKVQAGDLRKFVKNLIMARADLLKKFRNGEDLKTLTGIEKIFSPYLITIVDLLHSTTVGANSMSPFVVVITMNEIGHKYAPFLRKNDPEPLYAYFKEKLQPKDPQGSFTSFYTGLIGEQPGMTEYYLGAKDRKRDSKTKISQKAKNPRWLAIEEDLAWAVERDDALRMKRMKDGWKLTSLKTGEEVTPDEGITKILEKLEESYAKLDSWIEAFGKSGERTFWKKEWKNYYTSLNETYPNVMKELQDACLSGKADGAKFIVNRFGKKYEKIENRISLFESKEDFKRLQPIIQYYLLPSEIRKWIKLKYCEISKHDSLTMFGKDDSITEKLIECAADYLKKARNTDIVIIRGAYHASPRTRVPSHVGRGINQKDAFFWEGQGFLEAYLVEGVTDADEFPFFLFNEAMHVGNPTDILHEKIEKPEDIGRKIEHMELNRYMEYDKNWRKYISKSWEPMIAGVTVGQTDEMISVFDQIKSFAEGDFFGALLIEGAIGVGKTQSREAIKEFMGIYENTKNRVCKISCAGVPKKMTEIEHRFLGEKLGDGTFSPGILPELIKASPSSRGRSLLILDELPDASDNLQNFLITLLDDSGEIRLPDGNTLYLGNKLKIVCYSNKTIDDLPENMFREDLKNRISQTVRLPDLAKRGEDIVRLAEKFNYDFSKELGVPWAPIDENLGKMIKEWVDFYDRWSKHHTVKKTSMAIQIRDLKNLMKELILTRKGLLKGLETKGELSEKGKMRDTIEPEVKQIFSKDYLTIADVLYANTKKFFERKDQKGTIQGFLDNTVSKKHQLKKYSPEKPLTPYFKEYGAFDGKGKPVALYAGPKGDQPGMTLSVAGDDGASDDLGKKFPGLAAVLSDIPEKYNNHGVDYASLAEAFREAPLVAELRTKKIEDVEEYMGSFFEKIFKEKGEVETKLEENGIRGKKIQEIKIDVAVDVSSNFNIEEKTIDGSSVERSEENTYRFQVVFRQIIKGDGGEALSVKVQFPHGEEMVMITDVHLSTVTIPKEGVTALMQNFAANVLEDKGVPDDIQKIIAENVVTFSKMKEKSGLIFSKAAVFDNGLGLFLSKLARAGIQIGVVAPELWQRDAIAALNEEEKVNIVCLDNVGDAFDKMQASSYYYFKTEDDPDWSETRGIIQCDITGKIAIIIGALAAANHVTDVDVIKYMEQLADRFRQAV